MSLNIDLSYMTKNYKLTHVIAEDSGITLGAALKTLFEQRVPEGVEGAGFGIAPLDEALAMATVSVEGRANSFIEAGSATRTMKKVEDTTGNDLEAFIEGLAQGMGCTIHLRVLKGKDPHHIWEAAFRSLGIALNGIFEKNTWRKDVIAGVKAVLK